MFQISYQIPEPVRVAAERTMTPLYSLVGSGVARITGSPGKNVSEF